LISLKSEDIGNTHSDNFPLRSFAWGGAPILDVCSVKADYGHLLALTSQGELYGINCDEVKSQFLCSFSLPDLPSDDEGNAHFGVVKYRLHASLDGKYASVVVDFGKCGIVIDVLSGVVTMLLNGGDYYEETVPFSACFTHFEGRNVFIHRTEWNRLEVADPATGKSLTDRYIAPYEVGKPPIHHLDYFHGQLRPSWDGSRIFDDGWVWHPLSIPRTWSVTDWLRSNPWESEDGASVADLMFRDDWNIPACWISDRHIAVWGLAKWDDEVGEDVGQGTGVRILDADERKQSSDRLWPMDMRVNSVSALLSDGTLLYVVADTGTTVWDIASHFKITGLPNFSARLLDIDRQTLVAFGSDSITEFAFSWPNAKIQVVAVPGTK
jgi:hypothetical protein